MSRVVICRQPPFAPSASRVACNTPRSAHSHVCGGIGVRVPTDPDSILLLCTALNLQDFPSDSPPTDRSVSRVTLNRLHRHLHDLSTQTQELHRLRLFARRKFQRDAPPTIGGKLDVSVDHRLKRHAVCSFFAASHFARDACSSAYHHFQTS